MATARALEPIEKAAARERMSEGGKGAKVSQPSRATDKIGAFAGVSGRTVAPVGASVARVPGAAVNPLPAGGPERMGDRRRGAGGVKRAIPICTPAVPPTPNHTPVMTAAIPISI
jgi:hypothetical protein